MAQNMIKIIQIVLHCTCQCIKKNVPKQYFPVK